MLAALRSVDPLLPATNVGTMEQAVIQSSLGLTYLASLMGICGGIAFVLAVVGIYSVMAYAMSQRTHEFGVRMALGATAGDVLRLTLREGGTLAAAGVGIGVLLAVVFGRLMSGALFGVVAVDVKTVLGVSLARSGAGGAGGGLCAGPPRPGPGPGEDPAELVRILFFHQPAAALSSRIATVVMRSGLGADGRPDICVPVQSGSRRAPG